MNKRKVNKQRTSPDKGNKQKCPGEIKYGRWKKKKVHNTTKEKRK